MGQTRSAYHLYGKPGNSGENSNETDHPGGHFPFFSLLTETSEIFCFIIAELHPRAKRARGRSPIGKEM